MLPRLNPSPPPSVHLLSMSRSVSRAKAHFPHPPRRLSVWTGLASAPVLLLTLLACEPAPSSPTPTTELTPTATPSPASPTPERTPYRATVRRTAYGIHHIVADDVGSLGFGQGYTFATQHACILADQIVKVRSERSLYFGAGENDANLDSDFGYLHLGVMKMAAQSLERQNDEVRALIAGYVAGYNRFLEEVGPRGLPEDCYNAPWVKPISELDLMAYYTGMSMLSSSQALIPAMARAQPPSSKQQFKALPMPNMRELELGSNGIAIGSERSNNGQGMLLSNPHFAWEGELKFSEVQLTIPGRLNFYGVSLMGVAGILIGFNDTLAWTHTVSHATRGTFYQLSLTPADDTRYLYDGKEKALVSETYEIQVKQLDGALLPLQRTLWRSHTGPMIATDTLGWTRTGAITFRDANFDNEKLIEQFFRMATASSLEEFVSVHEEVNGIPWVHTMAVDAAGQAFYTDSSSVPALSEATLSAWEASLETVPLSKLAWELGAPLLDGSTSRDEWMRTDHPRQSGLIPFSDAPSLYRRDYVANGNNNHWLTHAEERLEGFSPMYLSERSPRTPRTRMNLRLLTESGPYAASGDDGKFSREELESLLMNNRGITAELLLEELNGRCVGLSTVVYENRPVNVQPLCQALSQFSGRMNLDAVGAAAWREFLGAFDFDALLDAGPLFREPFDPNNPVNTPYGLVSPPERGTDSVLTALAAAALQLEAANINPAARLRDVQYVNKSIRIPIHGSIATEGGVNQVSYSSSPLLNSTLLPRTSGEGVINSGTGLRPGGYALNYGTSFVMALQFTPEGPQARALLTYSQSSDPRSSYYQDQTQLFSQSIWRDIRFSEEEIAADPTLEVFEISNQP